MNNSLTWEPKSSIPKEGGVGGVYLLVFKGTPKRVIYVGQTKDFRIRLKQHLDAFLSSRRTIWRVESNQDIYEFMSYNGEKEAYKYYASLAKKGLLWAATDTNPKEPINQLNKKDNFAKNWLAFVSKKYVSNIEAWVCRTPHDERLRERIESQIQNSIRSYYSIGSHIHHHIKDMSFLGKVELADKKFDTPYTFTNAPDISDEFTKVLHNQIGASGEKYLKPAIALKKAELAEKKAAEAEKLRLVKEKYMFAGDSWKLLEESLLRRCLKLNLPIPEIAELLHRPPSEIKDKIKKF